LVDALLANLGVLEERRELIEAHIQRLFRGCAAEALVRRGIALGERGNRGERVIDR
jgi:hypothetical protein